MVLGNGEKSAKWTRRVYRGITAPRLTLLCLPVLMLIGWLRIGDGPAVIIVPPVLILYGAAWGILIERSLKRR